MKFLCLVYTDPSQREQVSDSEMTEIIRDTLAYRDELRRNGQYILSGPLESADSATTVKVRAHQTLVTDGPFVETREQVGGFYLIEAANEAEAIELVTKMPPARIDAIEVRALTEHDLDSLA
ncbi:MAG: YciI family protein [Thermomicrobiales bacterium]